MSTHVLKEKIGLPVWDGEFIVGTEHYGPGDTITTKDFEEARQDEEEQKMLIEHNCYTAEELKDLEEADDETA